MDVYKWKEKDHYEKLIFKSFREESVQAEIAVSLIDLDKEIHAKNNDNNKMYKGIYVVTEVSKRIPSLWFMVPLLYLSQITKIGNLVYRLIAKNRTMIPVNKCTDDICNINNV